MKITKDMADRVLSTNQKKSLLKLSDVFTQEILDRTILNWAAYKVMTLNQFIRRYRSWDRADARAMGDAFREDSMNLCMLKEVRTFIKKEGTK